MARLNSAMDTVLDEDDEEDYRASLKKQKKAAKASKKRDDSPGTVRIFSFLIIVVLYAF